MKSKIQIAKNALYTSDKAIQEMVFVISEVIETHFGQNEGVEPFCTSVRRNH